MKARIRFIAFKVFLLYCLSYASRGVIQIKLLLGKRALMSIKPTIYTVFILCLFFTKSLSEK